MDELPQDYETGWCSGFGLGTVAGFSVGFAVAYLCAKFFGV